MASRAPTASRSSSEPTRLRSLKRKREVSASPSPSPSPESVIRHEPAAPSQAEDVPAAPERLVLLQLATKLESTQRVRKRRVVVHSQVRARLYVPPHLVRHFPVYNILLGQATSTESAGWSHQIYDQRTRSVDEVDTIAKMFHLLAGNPLPSIGPGVNQVAESLDELRELYLGSVEHKVKVLEDAILLHIESFPAIPTKQFLVFAKKTYEKHALNSPISGLIKRKLAVMLPELLQDGKAQEIKAGGGKLGSALFEVMIEQFPRQPDIKVEQE